MRRLLAPAAVFVAYAALALATTARWWTPLGGRGTAVNAPDATLFSWLLTWTPHALAAGRNPLLSPAMNAPDGINLMWNNGMPLPAVLLAPVTATLGGMATVTVLVTLGLAGSAASAFWCLRAWGVATLPAALGGGLFGFSPGMTAQALGHPDLMFAVLAPVIVHLAVRLATAPRWRTAAVLGVVAGAQVLVGEEILFLSAVAAAVLLLVLAVSHPRRAVRRLPAFAACSVVALVAFLLVGGGPLAFQFAGPLRQTGSPFTVASFGVDLTGLITPTPLQLLTDGPPYPDGLEERTGFLGVPLLLFAGVLSMRFARRERVRAPMLAALFVGVLALGETLRIGGHDIGVGMPWAALSWLPGFEHVIADRLALLTAGLLGAGLAFALDAAGRDADVLGAPARSVEATTGGSVPAGSSRRAARWRAAGAAVVMVVALLPVLPAPLPGADVDPAPGWFTSPAVARCPGGSLLVLPYPSFFDPGPMRWQEASGMAFAMPGGYFIGPAADGHAYVGGQPSVTGQLFAQVQNGGQVQPVTPALHAAFAADLRRWKTCAVVLGPSRHLDAVQAQASALLGRQPQNVDGVLLWPAPPG